MVRTYSAIAIDAPTTDALVEMASAPELAGELAERARPVIDAERKAAEDWTLPLGEGWSMATWRTWLKTRLGKAMLFSSAGATREPAFDNPTCTLHVFFLFLEETPEMWARLRNEQFVATNKPARSKISKTPLANIQPIDTTAARVGPRQ